MVDQLERITFADIPCHNGARGEDEDVALLVVFDLGGLVGDLDVDDLGVEAGVEGVELVILSFEEFGGGGDVVGFGGAVGSHRLLLCQLSFECYYS